MMQKKVSHFHHGKAGSTDSKSNKKPKGKSPAFKKVMRGGAREDAEIKTLQAKYAAIDTANVRSFGDLPLSRKTMMGLQKCKFKTPTEIQQQSIGYALQGRDVLGAAITG